MGPLKYTLFRQQRKTTSFNVGFSPGKCLLNGGPFSTSSQKNSSRELSLKTPLSAGFRSSSGETLYPKRGYPPPGEKFENPPYGELRENPRDEGKILWKLSAKPSLTG